MIKFIHAIETLHGRDGPCLLPILYFRNLPSETALRAGALLVNGASARGFVHTPRLSCRIPLAGGLVIVRPG